MKGSRAGAALVVVVLITLALFACGHGLLVLALGELAASRAGARHLEARMAAESALRLAAADSGRDWMDSVDIDAERLVGTWRLGRAEGSASAWRLTRETWWLEGVGRTGAGTSRTARLAWALDPLERTLALDAAVTVGWSSVVVADGQIDGGGTSTGDALLDASCDPWRTALDARYGVDTLTALATLTPADTLPGLGFLEFHDLLDAAEITVLGAVSPAPVESQGECSEAEPLNWGDPDHPWRPCGLHLPLRGSGGDLRMVGGAGQGVLVVDGDLELVAGARFHGFAAVRGVLRIADGGQLVGMVVAAGGVHVATGGSVRGSACWAVRSLAAQRAVLGGFLLLPETGSLGPL
jgi:hypothetical protein